MTGSPPAWSHEEGKAHVNHGSRGALRVSRRRNCTRAGAHSREGRAKSIRSARVEESPPEGSYSARGAVRRSPHWQPRPEGRFLRAILAGRSKALIYLDQIYA